MRNLTATDLQQLREQLNSLSTAVEYPIVYVKEGPDGTKEPVPAQEYKAIVNNKDGRLETVASKGYVIIQHRDAFGAVLDAMAAASKGAKFQASIMEDKGRAWMTVCFSDIKADDGLQGIELGIKVKNSYDKTSALKYSGTQKENKEGHFEFFGYRLACSNGMTVRVALGDLANVEVKDKAQAQVGEIVAVNKEFVVTKTEEQGAKAYIRHYGKNTEFDLDRVRQMMLALPAVARRLEEQIQTAQKISLTKEEAEKRLEELGFGPRLRERILERFACEELTAWGLYNATTAYATHEVKVSPSRMEEIIRTAEQIMVARA